MRSLAQRRVRDDVSAMTGTTNGVVDWVAEALAPLGEVVSRPMMGGLTLYCDGVVFAIVAADELWLKADRISDAAWDAIGAERFATAPGRTMNYRRAPGDCYDDVDAMREWATVAIEAGRRGKPSRRRR